MGFFPVSGMLSSFSCTFYLYLHLSRFCFIRVGTIIFHLSRFAHVNWIYDVNTELRRVDICHLGWDLFAQCFAEQILSFSRRGD